MQENPTIEMLRKEECCCVFCQSRDRDITEFYTVRIEGGVSKAPPQPIEVLDMLTEFCKRAEEKDLDIRAWS